MHWKGLKMKFILLVVIFLICSFLDAQEAKSAQLEIAIASYHYKLQKDDYQYNQNNLGIGLDFNGHMFGYYHNSVYANTYYFGNYYKLGQHLRFEMVYATGYQYMPITPMPVFAWDVGNMVLRITADPINKLIVFGYSLRIGSR